MKKPTWIEVAVNGAWTRARQPHIPLSPEDIVEQALACAKEGASIVHYHAYDPRTGRQTSDPDVNIRIIEEIKSRADIIVYPAISGITALQALSPEAGESRYAMHRQLAERGLIEWMVVDPGSVNMSPLESPEGASGPQGQIYINSEQSLHAGFELARRHDIHPSYAIYEPGFIRLGAALARRYGTPAPIYRLMFSDQFSFGCPPKDFALEMYVKLLELQAPFSPWMIAGLGVDIMPLVSSSVALGGHVRVGLEDALLGCSTPNFVCVRQARAAVERAGGVVARACDVRAALARP
jgi:uncharacterized protein (DUF849 family)